MAKPTIFISYSHKDEEWKDRLVTHLRVLEKQGLLQTWDDRKIDAGADWRKQIEHALSSARIAILMITANFLTSDFILNEEVPRLLEGRQKEGVRVIPLIIKPCAWKTIPWLRPINAHPKEGRPLSGGSEYQIDKDLASLAEAIEKLINPGALAKTEKFAPPPPDKINTSKLPPTSPMLFGREEELKILDKAWENEGTKIVSLVAWGGVGKTALVNVWLNQMAKDHFRGAERVLGYSFYSQGAAEGKQASADPFINFALTWFGDPDPTQGSPWDKGVRLAGLICQQRTLIILDGLEPVQYPPGVMEGRLKDPALQSLLRELMRHNPGLCIITTRLAVADLQPCEGSTVLSKNLEHLSTAAGAHLLSHLGVKGKPIELQNVADEFDGHALTLTLLGRYLAVAYQGDIRQRDRIGRMTSEKKQGAHAFKVMEAYERWFKDKPELNILYLMGLFDRPAPGGAIAVLKAKPAIKGLTAKLVPLPDEDWRYALACLREVHLLAKQDPDDPDTLDCHPLVREHFGQKLRDKAPGAWRMAHERLYDYYKNLPEKELPDTLEEMEPLFAAVNHGCQAGLASQVLHDIYWKRIQRGKEFFGRRKLGAIGAELATLASFFENPWNQLIDGLNDNEKGFVLNAAGFILRAFGRISESVQPMQAGLNANVALQDWRNAALAASNLSSLYLSLGDSIQASNFAQQSLEIAKRSGDVKIQIDMHAALASVLLQRGYLAKAKAQFQYAEKMQQALQPDFRFLYSIQGFHYCDFLLSQGKHREVLERAGQTLEWVSKMNWVLDIALDKLSLGWAYLLEGGEKMNTTSKVDLIFKKSADYVNQAVAGLREAGTQDHLPRGLFARAFLYRVQSQFSQAWDDLAEALEIAERGGMKLHLLDYHLEAGRVVSEQLEVGNFQLLVDGRKTTANRDEMIARLQEHVKQADILVQQTGYHRRDPEVELGYADLFFVQGDQVKAREHLARGKKLLDKMGIRMWDLVVRELEEKL